MKLRLTLFFVLITTTLLNAQPATVAEPANYGVAVSFGSKCCGTASDRFLKDFIKDFNLKNKVTINGFKMDGCGREGEYKILFSIDKLKEAKKVKLIAALKKLIYKQNDKNKTVKASSGNINLGYDLPLSELKNCRGELVKWIPTK